MLRFRIILRKYRDTPSRISRFPATLFFPCTQGTDGEFVEVGEDRIFEVTLPIDDVAKLQHDYMQPNAADAVKDFISHQVGYGSSWPSWISAYNHFVVTEVKQLPDAQ